MYYINNFIKICDIYMFLNEICIWMLFDYNLK